jgi:hypothetical protein
MHHALGHDPRFAGDRVELYGGAGAGSWSYQASYGGTLQGGVMEMTGHQLWSGQLVGGAFDRACRVRLMAGG